MQRQLFIDEYENVISFLVKAKLYLEDECYVAVEQADDPRSKIFIYKLEKDVYGNNLISIPDRREMFNAMKMYQELKYDVLQ